MEHTKEEKARIVYGQEWDDLSDKEQAYLLKE